MIDIVEVSIVSLVHEQVESAVLVEHQVTQVVTELVKELDVLTVDSVDVLEVTTPEIVVITQGQQGPPGPPGVPGPAGGQTLQRIAGTDLSALLVVYEDLFGSVWPADHDVERDVLALLGVTVSAASGGQPINVQRMGTIDDPSWQWLPQKRVFLGKQGRLTQEPPQSGHDVLIGTALSATRLLLNIQDPIELE